MVAVLAVAACGSSTPTTTRAPQDPQVNVLAASTDFAVGHNRFSFALFDFDGNPVEDARAEVAFGPDQDGTTVIKSVAQATYRRVVTSFTHTHAGGATESHDEARGVYVVDDVVFESPRIWVAFVTAAAIGAGKPLSGSLAFQVRERSATPAIGERVPATRNPTAADVADLSDIDSSISPRPELHQVSIAQALERKRPFVVVFATPTFCRSRICGPVTDVVASLYPQYHDRVDFIHIEPYELGPLRNEGLFRLSPYAKEWNLPTEPWTFLVNADGRLFAKFEALASEEELEAALQRMLSGSSG